MKELFINFSTQSKNELMTFNNQSCINESKKKITKFTVCFDLLKTDFCLGIKIDKRNAQIIVIKNTK